MHSEAVLVHFPIYLGLGAYGHGMCLHSLQIRMWAGLGWRSSGGALRQPSIRAGSQGRQLAEAGEWEVSAQLPHERTR